jgi:hypothetical protein
VNNEAAITPVGGSRGETWRYTGPLGDAEFEAPARSIFVPSLRWVGRRSGEPISETDRSALIGELRRLYREQGEPFELVFPSGEVEDETGCVRPGFRSALPRAEHSDGWSVVDLFLSPEYPDADEYPPTIEYTDASGVIEIPRQIEMDGGSRRCVLHLSSMRRIGEHEGDPIDGEERARIVERVRIVYDRWGPPYEVR